MPFGIAGVLTVAIALVVAASVGGTADETQTIATYSTSSPSVSLIWRLDASMLCDGTGGNCRFQRSNFVVLMGPRDGALFSIRDCSNARFACLDGFVPLAFPHRPRAQGGAYVRLGFAFTYQCTEPGDQGRCRVFAVTFRPTAGAEAPVYGSFVYEVGFGVRSITTLEANGVNTNARYDFQSGRPFLAP